MTERSPGSEVRRWLVEPGSRVDLRGIDASSTEGAPGDKAATNEVLEPLLARLSDLQLRLWAEHRRSLLVVLQAMDAGGKDGTIRRVFSGVNPQGVRVTSFKAPTSEELRRDFLWRIHAHVPAHGEIGLFNRSHYEDVLIARVEGLVPESVWRPRYETIRAFEASLVAARTTIVKVFLHISRDEQAARLQRRLDDPTRRWKFEPADLEGRARWDDYQDAYEDALSETSTDAAPWFVVPSDRKWYRTWAVMNIVVGALEGMDPQFPAEPPGLDGIVVT